jgi:hypothetical protein
MTLLLLEIEEAVYPALFEVIGLIVCVLVMEFRGGV